MFLGNIENPDKKLRRWFGLLLLIHIVTAFFSLGTFHCDEHFQIIEFVGYKLGWVPASGLAWEYSSQIRPWIQPFLYFLPVKLLVQLGVQSPSTLELVMRIMSGTLGWSALAILSRSLFIFLNRTSRAFWIVFLFSSFFFFSQFHVRTSSESMSSAFLMFAFAQALSLSVDSLKYFSVGCLLGLAFESRYQTAFAGFGLAAWVFFSTTKKRRCFVFGTLGGLLVLLLASFVDRWGYGSWVFPSYRYATVNIIEGKAATFGVSPWWEYFVSFRKSNVGLYGGILLLSVIGGIVCVAQGLKKQLSKKRLPLETFAEDNAPKFLENVRLASLTSMCSMTLLPFIVGHCAIGHKEDRFLYPVVWLMWLLVLIVIAVPLTNWLEKKDFGSKTLRLLLYFHMVLSASLILRNAFSELSSRAPVLSVIEREAEKVSFLKLNLLDGVNPYAMSCGGSVYCASELVSEFSMPKNLRVECDTHEKANLRDSLVLQTYQEDTLQLPNPPVGCRTLYSTLPFWVPPLASRLSEATRARVFKKFHFHVLWDCRSSWQ